MRTTILTMVLSLSLILSNQASSITINVGSSSYTYGHNYVSGGNPRGFSSDYYAISGGWFESNKWFLGPQSSGYMVYKFQADPGCIISNVNLSACAYLEGGSDLQVLYRPTNYSGTPDFSTGWTNLGYSFVYNQDWITSFQPNSNAFYLAYNGANNGSYAYQFQLIRDQVNMNVVRQIDVGSGSFTYGHNYLGNANPHPFGGDFYDKLGGFFSNNCWYLNPGTSGYMIYRLQAAPGHNISEITINTQTYFEARSWLAVLYRTADYAGTPNFAHWTNLGYSYPGYGNYWTRTIRPNRNTVYLAYQGQNSGTQPYQFQIQKDRLDVTSTSSVSIVATYLHPGDANGDGTVNSNDQTIVQSNLNSPGSWFEGDFNGDGQVTTADLTILQNNLNYQDPQNGLYVDRYFQWRANDWSGKLKSDLELRNRIAEEDQIMADWDIPQGFDSYGGSTTLGWQETATGYFRVVKRPNGYWWLIKPSGYPCFYIGLNSIGGDTDRRWPPCPVNGRENFFDWLPSHNGDFYSAWMADAWGSGQEHVLPITCNLIRKYGQNWGEIKNQQTFCRLKKWGFSGGGKWCSLNAVTPYTNPYDVPWIPVLSRNGVPNLVNHPDIFDASVRATFDSVIGAQCQSYLNNSWILGLSLGNEDAEMIFTAEIQSVMALASVPAKRALVDYAYTNIYSQNLSLLASTWNVTASTLNDIYASTSLQIPSQDLEQLRLYYLDQYYSFIYSTVKKYDPNHLYFGCWTPAWRCEWINPDGSNGNDWRTIAKYCDVIGYDHYDHIFARTEMQNLINSTQKPIFVGEFGWGPAYSNQRGFLPGGGGDTHPNTDAEEGVYYTNWITAAANEPCCVGVAFFAQIDQPYIGQGPGQGANVHLGESCAWGLIDVTDTPKWDLIGPVRTSNLQANTVRNNR